MAYKSKLSGYAPQSNPCYQIEDIGPGGGTVFSIPGQGINNTNYYFEVAPHDVSATQRSSAVMGQSCTGQQNSIPGAEFGVYMETILPGDNGTNVGDGYDNTMYLNSYPTSWGGFSGNPTNPVLDTHTLAAGECSNYVGPNGHTDWFLPSLDEATELMLNLGPPSPVGNVANLNTSNANPADAFYWTSSVIPYSGYDDIAIGFNATGFGGAQMMDRCTTGSVRPIRRFECPVTPARPPDCGIMVTHWANPGVGNFNDIRWYPDIGSLSVYPGTSLFSQSTLAALTYVGGNTGLTNPANINSGIGAINLFSEVARYHDKIWVPLRHQVGSSLIYPFPPNYPPYSYNPGISTWSIVELDFDINTVTASFNRAINLPQPYGDVNAYNQGADASLNGGSGIDGTTLAMFFCITSVPGSAEIVTFDVSTNPATVVSSISIPTYARDVQRLLDGSYVIVGPVSANTAFGPDRVTHLTSAGGVIGTVDLFPPGSNVQWTPYHSWGVFCNDGDVYVGTDKLSGSGQRGFQKLDLSTMTLSPRTVLPHPIGDAGGNPGCCPNPSSSSSSSSKLTLEQQIKKWGI